VAPFAKLPSDYHYNMVNGMVSADAWKYIFSFDLTRDKPEFIMEFPKPQELTGIEWIGNAFYHLVTRLELSDGVNTAALAVKPGNEPQSLEIKPAVKGSRITLKITDWAKVSTGANVVGVDNIRLTARRSPEFLVRVHPLLNNGGLMQYDMGKGGIVLCNLLIKEREQVPDNATKKLRILSALLRNLRAPFSGSATVIAGENLDYEPVDLSKAANQYKDARACFGDRERTLADLPNVLTGWLGPLVESPRLLMVVMMLVLIVIGTALDLTPTILIFAPVMLPIAVKAGIDPVYFGLMFVLNGAIGLITPPVGTVLNVVAGVGKLSLHQVIKGVNPFLLTYTVILFLFVLFPQIVTAPVAWML
jgi:hypothetical protein